MEYKIIEKKAPKVAIVGYAGTRDKAPYDKPEEFEIWGLNDLFEFIPRYDRWFDIHERYSQNMDNFNTRGKQKPYIQRLAELNIPTYMVEDYDIVPGSIKYPLDLMRKEFGQPRLDTGENDPYFTNSISFMIALAIHEQFKEIHIYGVDMATMDGGEYAYQRPSCEYYLGIAKGRGIPVYVPLESDLLKSRFVYGYEMEKQNAFEAKIHSAIQGMQERQTEAQRVAEHHKDVYNQYIGGIQAARDLLRVWG